MVILLNKAIEEKGGKDRKVRFVHDNAPYTAKATIKKLNSFKWDILPHQPYSPDLVPTDYYLFHSFSNALLRKTFNSDCEMEEWIKSFFDEKPALFYKKGITDVKKRSKKVLENDGKYFD